MLLPTLVLLLVSFCKAEERFNPHRITLAPRADNTLIPTVTLAPVTSFNQSLLDGVSVNVTGPQIQLVTDVPSLNGDALLALGPDAAAGLEVAYQENCPNGLDSPNCEPSLQLALNVDQQNLQKRVIQLIVPVLIVGMAIEFAEMRKSENAISRIRMPSPNVAILSSVQGASTVVIATQTNGGNLITAVPSPTVDSSSQLSVATVTVDSSFAQMGDLIFAMPPEVGFALSQIVETYGRCTVTRKRSCDPFETAGYVAAAAISEVKPGGVLNDLITMPTDISFGNPIQLLAAQLPLVIAYGRQITALAANSALLNAAATFLLLAVYAELTTTAPNPTRLIIPASDFSMSQKSLQTGSPCPQRVPNCSNCGGSVNPQSGPWNTPGICVGVKTSKFAAFAAGCVCADPNDSPGFHPYSNTSAIRQAQAFLVGVAAFNSMNGSSTVSTSSLGPVQSTTSSSATPAATTPIRVCQDFTTYCNGCTFHSVSATTVNATVTAFRNQYPNGPMTSTSGNITQVYSSNPYYLMNVGWIEGCAGPSQSLTNPVASNSSIQVLDLLRNAYLDCKDTNLGVGGWYDVGCLRYGFYPTLVKMGGSPPNATLFFDVGKYCG